MLDTSSITSFHLYIWRQTKFYCLSLPRLGAMRPDERAARLDDDEFAGKQPHPNILEMYANEAEVHDKPMIERWKMAMESMLTFSSLFSIVITVFIIESYKTLLPDSSDLTVVYLYQVSQQLSAIANETRIPASALLPPPNVIPFTPSRYAVTANVLWFISLGLTLACAIIATLAQQWVRTYAHATGRHQSAERRAHIRMYLFEGVKMFRMADIIDAVPSLLHIALFTFFLGLILFIKPINHVLTVVSIVILTVSTSIYLLASLLPILFPQCPIQTPLTNILWNAFRSDNLDSTRSSAASEKNESFQEREKRGLAWLIGCLDEDRKIIPFLEGTASFLDIARTSTSWPYDPIKSLSSLFRNRGLRFFARLHLLLRKHSDNPRVVSTYVDFMMLVDPQSHVDPLHDESPFDSCDILQRFATHNPTCSSDLRLKINCLQAIMVTSWLSSNAKALDEPVFWRNPAWSSAANTLWRQLLERLEVPESMVLSYHRHPDRQYMPYFTLAKLVLDTVSDLNSSNAEVLSETMQILMKRLFIPLHFWDCTEETLPLQQQRFHCATVSLIVSAFASLEVVPEVLGGCMRQLLHLLVHASDSSCLRIINELLQSDFWTKNLLFEREFIYIVETHSHKQDQFGTTYLSPQVITKYRVVRMEPWRGITSLDETITGLDLRGIDPRFQTRFVEQANTILFGHLHAYSDGSNYEVVVGETIMSVFYTLDDPSALGKALEVVNVFLEHRPMNERGLRCTAYLRAELSRYPQTKVVQTVLTGRPSRGVQVELGGDVEWTASEV